MSNPVILFGTAEDGSTLPVQVDATGRLVAQGLPGPEGPQGDPGVGELPPNPGEGQVLGWENGQLVWMDPPAGGFFFELDYLLVGGGGAKGYDGRYANAGGGGGGLITSITGEMSGGGVAGAGALKVPLDANGVLATGIAGNEGQDTTFVIPGLSLTAKAGGDAGQPGGSGGGAFQTYTRYADIPGAAGYPGQGYNGGNGFSGNEDVCWTDPNKHRCVTGLCNTQISNGGGGGAGGAGDRREPGPGVASTITGTSLIYAPGGAGQSYCESQGGSLPAGSDNYGAGQGWQNAAQPGVLYLRYPNFVLLESRSGSGTLETTEADGVRVSKITNGYCSLHFKLQPGVVMSAVIDYLRRLRD